MSDPRVSRQSDRCPDVTNVVDLWNTATAPADQGTLDFLQTGDRCFVTFSKTMYLCTSPTPGAATWAPYPGAGGGGGGFNQLPIAIVFCNALGVVLAARTGGRAITVANAAGHVAGSGAYSHALGGADLPATVVAELFPSGGGIAKSANVPVQPSPLLLELGRPNIAGGSVVGATGVFTGYGLTVNRTGTGVYDCNLLTGSNIIPQVTLQGALPVGDQVAVEPITGTNFIVRTADNADVAKDVDFFVGGVPGAANLQVTPDDYAYSFVLFDATS